MKLTSEEFRTLRILAKENAHDTIDNPIPQLDRVIERGYAEIERMYFRSWGGKRHKIREVTITDAGRAALASDGKRGGE